MGYQSKGNGVGMVGSYRRVSLLEIRRNVGTEREETDIKRTKEDLCKLSKRQKLT